MTKQRTYDVGFFSSADRGLECLLNMLPEIEKQLGRPVKSVWAYGWNSFDVMHAKNSDKMKWKWQMIRKMNDVGMESKGRLSHTELAKLMKDTKVLAYPTEFTEIHMITMLKAQEAGMHCIHTGVAATMETGKNATIIKCDDIYSNKEKQQEFIAAVVQAIENPVPTKQVENVYWTDVAQVWDGVMT